MATNLNQIGIFLSFLLLLKHKFENLFANEQNLKINNIQINSINFICWTEDGFYRKIYYVKPYITFNIYNH